MAREAFSVMTSVPRADRIRSRIGYMAEYEAMSGKMTAYDQVRYSGELLGMNVDAAISRAHEALDYVGLGEQRYRKVETYSTGMKQAAKLACALDPRSGDDHRR